MISNTPYFQNIQSTILLELDKSDSSVKLAISWLTDKVLFHKLYSLCRKGKKVEILLNYDNINLSSNIDYEMFTKSGGIIYWEYPDINQLMYNKYCIIDNCSIINGSYNWTNNARKNNENIVVIKNDFELIKQFENDFYRLTNQKHRINLETFSLPVEHILTFNSYDLFINWWSSIKLILKIVLTERILMKTYDFNSLPNIDDYELINNCTNIDIEWTGNLLLKYSDVTYKYEKDFFESFKDNLDTLDGFEVFIQLEYLNCSSNDIIDFYPISKLTNLLYLNLMDSGRSLKIYNEIEFNLIHLQSLRNLEYLNLSNNNKITNYESLFHLKKLKTLIIDGCGLSVEEVNNLERRLPNCEIISNTEFEEYDDEALQMLIDYGCTFDTASDDWPDTKINDTYFPSMKIEDNEKTKRIEDEDDDYPF